MRHVFLKSHVMPRDRLCKHQWAILNLVERRSAPQNTILSVMQQTCAMTMEAAAAGKFAPHTLAQTSYTHTRQDSGTCLMLMGTKIE